MIKQWLSILKNEQFVLLICLFLVVFFPILKVGFTTVDDTDISISYGLGKSIFEVAEILASSQGRISFFWGYPILRVPYIFESSAWFYLTKVFGFCALIFGLYFAIERTLAWKRLGLLSVVLFIALIQNGWEYNAFGSYPFAFNIYCASFLMALGFSKISLETKNLRYSYIAGLFYLVSLASEVFVLLFPLFIFISYLDEDHVNVQGQTTWLNRPFGGLLFSRDQEHYFR